MRRAFSAAGWRSIGDITIPVFKRKLQGFAKKLPVYIDDPICH
jgi:hypothetical protein